MFYWGKKKSEMWKSRFFELLKGSAVAGIAKPRADVAIFIELTVQGSDIERNFRIFLMEGFDSFRSGDDAEEMNFLHAMLI